jgi:hypothetical protein
MRHLCIAIAASGALLAAGMSACQAGATRAVPPPPGFEPLPYAYRAPHGYRPYSLYGLPPRHALTPYAYGVPPRYGPPPQYGLPPQYGPPRGYAAPPYAFDAPRGYGREYGAAPPGYGPLPYAYGSPPGYGPNPEYGPPARTYDPPPDGMPRDPGARYKAWSEISDSFTEALRQVWPASSHDEFASRSATRPR